MELNKQKLWMEHALVQAKQAFANDEIPIGCVIILNDKIIAKGYNQCELLNDPTAHAEMIAITSASSYLKNWRLNECSLVVTKEPCAMCAGAIINSRIKTVLFGAYDEQHGCCGSSYNLCYNPKSGINTIIRGGILMEDCKGLILNFFNKKRNSP